MGDANSLEIWNSICGAGLGACFYILVRTQKYLVERTYDPKYNNAYLTRWFTGVIAGFVLAELARKGLFNDAKGAMALGPGVIAIIGGFSAEAVEQVLTRISEVLVAAVRGDGSAQSQARLMEETAKRNVEIRQKLVEVEQVVSADPAKLKAKLAEIHTALGTSPK